MLVSYVFPHLFLNTESYINTEKIKIVLLSIVVRLDCVYVYRYTMLCCSICEQRSTVVVKAQGKKFRKS